MQLVLVFQLLVLLTIANGSPVVATKIFGDAFSRQLDGGVLFLDGRPLFGPTKTMRGVVVSLLATPIVGALIGLGAEVGILVAAGAMAGDLLSSFVKRRMGLPPSAMALGLDQIPESFIPLAACRTLLPLTTLDIVAALTIFFVGELVLSRILYRLHLRDRPF